MAAETTTPTQEEGGLPGEEVFSPEELRALSSLYFSRLSSSERRLLASFEQLLREDGAESARLAAFAELRRSPPLRAYLAAEEACRLAEKAEALGVLPGAASNPPRASKIALAAA